MCNITFDEVRTSSCSAVLVLLAHAFPTYTHAHALIERDGESDVVCVCVCVCENSPLACLCACEYQDAFGCANGILEYDRAGSRSCSCFQGYIGFKCEIQDTTVMLDTRFKSQSSHRMAEAYWKAIGDNTASVSVRPAYRIGYDWYVCACMYGPTRRCEGMIAHGRRERILTRTFKFFVFVMPPMPAIAIFSSPLLGCTGETGRKPRSSRTSRRKSKRCI